ncbi:hypothetical protein BS47DRAFT_1361831 [Hydnum rufescens UP504]|uniref:Uncharacterized protein n=1 Tax=Hydnum rufescens UP504 TaxID=1448309 RepID=A0A9P6AYG4_9AGAM|nr:hypothetical protein BS47DRAFT_1361831 [Hydnum rufescens UP504]
MAQFRFIKPVEPKLPGDPYSRFLIAAREDGLTPLPQNWAEEGQLFVKDLPSWWKNGDFMILPCVIASKYEQVAKIKPLLAADLSGGVSFFMIWPSAGLPNVVLPPTEKGKGFGSLMERVVKRCWGCFEETLPLFYMCQDTQVYPLDTVQQGTLSNLAKKPLYFVLQLD